MNSKKYICVRLNHRLDWEQIVRRKCSPTSHLRPRFDESGCGDSNTTIGLHLAQRRWDSTIFCLSNLDAQDLAKLFAQRYFFFLIRFSNTQQVKFESGLFWYQTKGPVLKWWWGLRAYYYILTKGFSFVYLSYLSYF